MPGKEENAGIVWRTLQGIYRGCLRSGRGTRARYSKGQRRETGSREPKEWERKPTRGSRNCESAKRGWGMVKGRVLGRPKEPYARRGRDEPRTRGLGASVEGVQKKRRRGLCAGGKPKTRGCGTGAGIYEQAGTRARTKERAEGAGGKLVWGCFAFLMGLERVNATPPSRKTPFVDKIRRYVSYF